MLRAAPRASGSALRGPSATALSLARNVAMPRRSERDEGARRVTALRAPALARWRFVRPVPSSKGLCESSIAGSELFLPSSLGMKERPATLDLAKLLYERGEGRNKHRWDRDRAGFCPGSRGPVGKCHRSITEPAAASLLRNGLVEDSPYCDRPHAPDCIYNVYRGVPYVAVPTQPGKSYHGYPWQGRMSASIRGRLRERAVEDGHGTEFDRWLKQYAQ
jgi:hypothetical protein